MKNNLHDWNGKTGRPILFSYNRIPKHGRLLKTTIASLLATQKCCYFLLFTI